MSDEVKAMAVVEYTPGQILQSTSQYTVQRINSSRLKTYRLIIAPPLGYVEQTATPVITYVQIPVSHRLLKAGWSHTTSAPGTASVDAATTSLAAEIFGAAVAPVRYDYYTGTASSHYVELEAFGYHEPQTRYVISTDTTNTDRMYLWMDIQVISEGV